MDQPAKKTNVALIVVIVLLAVGLPLLEAIGVIVVAVGFLFTARQVSVQQAVGTGQAHVQLQMIQQALEIYHLELNQYPSTEQGLDALIESPPELEETWDGPYLAEASYLDPWGNPYGYRQLGPDEFEIRSAGPDGIDGTPDDIWSDNSF